MGRSGGQEGLLPGGNLCMSLRQSWGNSVLGPEGTANAFIHW